MFKNMFNQFCLCLFGRELNGGVSSDRGRSVDSAVGGSSEHTSSNAGDSRNRATTENITPRRRSRLGSIWQNIRRTGNDVGNAAISSATNRLATTYNR